MAVNFIERAIEMGLNIDLAYKGLLSYTDQYSSVIYRQLYTGKPTEDSNHEHETDGKYIPLIAIYTKAPEWDQFKYVGYVSNLYQFIGNDVLNQRIRDSILEVGIPIVTENVIMKEDMTVMRNEIIIQNGQNVANVGDILPVMIVSNSYNGTKAATMMFGITMEHGASRTTFAFRLGEMRQVHISTSNTTITSAVNSYMQAFNEGIADMITQSFNSRLTEQQMLGTLDLIEGIGKKRREGVSAMLDAIQGESHELPTAWQMFLAIVRYNSFEENLNAKRLMENAAESVLVIPARMIEVLERLQS